MEEGDKNLLRIVATTTFGASAYDKYAYKFIDSFIKFWPSNIKLRVYYDEVPIGGWRNNDARIAYIPLNMPSIESFKERNRNNPLQKNTSGNDFYCDCIRFCHKVFAYVDSSLLPDIDLSIWLDADICTHSEVTHEAVLGWLNSKMAGSLFRENIRMYTETGFIIFDMRYVEARQFMESWIQQYTMDKIWNLPLPNKKNKFLGLTDCHAYDAVRLEFSRDLWNDLSPKGIKTRHPFINGILGKHMDHYKGDCKKQGRSRSSDLKVKRNEKYWRDNK